MVLVTLDDAARLAYLDAIIVTYGHAATREITEQLCQEIETTWNEPGISVRILGAYYQPKFRISGLHNPSLQPMEVITNTDPRMNYFRIEAVASGNISFVDGIGSNTGYFQADNLYLGSTTAAHEFGHGLGLDHPVNLDIRGLGRPGIMYPRGTWVDPEFQYDPAARPGEAGGTMHPMHRKVQLQDLQQLHLDRLRFSGGQAILGAFTNIYHPDHGRTY